MVEALAIDVTGNVWIGTLRGLAKFDGEDWTVYIEDNPELLRDRIRVLATDVKGNVWVGTYRGLAKFDGTGWTVYNTDNSELPSNTTNALAVDGQGNLWIGTSGLARFDGRNWTLYTEDNSGLPSNTILALAVDNQGTLWIGTSAGLAQLETENWTVYNKDNPGLPDDYVSSLVIDSQGNLWIGTRHGSLAVYHKGGVILTDVEEDYRAELPSVCSLSQNYPNPFNATTEMSFSIPEQSHVKIAVYMVLGQLVRELTDGAYAPGVYHVRWDGIDRANRPVSSGVYVVRMITDAGILTEKMMVLR